MIDYFETKSQPIAKAMVLEARGKFEPTRAEPEWME
jgi:hypothetical protein